jgi:hypothetical protein
MTASVRTADFTNVKDRSKYNKSRIKEGDYLAVIAFAEDSEVKNGQNKGAFQYEIGIRLKKRSQSVFPYFCSLDPKMLWKLRNLLVAAGVSVPKAKQKIDLNRIVGREIGVTIEDADDYKDREQSELTAVFPASELDDPVMDDDDDDDDEAPDNSGGGEIDESYDDGDDSLDDLDDVEDVDVEDDAVEEEPEEEVAEGDEWDEITDRLELRKALKKVAPDVKTSTKQTEDDIRDLIRDAVAKAAAAKAKPAAKSKAKAAPTDEELEELDIDDL